MTVRGANFDATSIVQWNGANRITTALDNGALTATIPSGDLVSGGEAQVTVVNAANQRSVALVFTIGGSWAATQPASSTTSSNAQLNGSVNPNGSNGSMYFKWGTDPGLASPKTTSRQTVVPSDTTQVFTASLGGGLAANTTYYFQNAFYNSANGTYRYGAILSFSTLNTPVTTAAATGITSSAATLNGSVNPNGSTGTIYFKWGTDPYLASPNTTGNQTVASNSTDQSFNASLTGLSTNTKYYFQTVFYNSANGRYQYGSIRTASTLSASATSLPATGVTSSASALNGSVNPNGSTGTIYFQWGTDPGLASPNVTNNQTVAANSTPQTFSTSLSGLSTDAKYYFQMVFYNSANGTVQYGAILNFLTLNVSVTTVGATGVSGSVATLNGNVNPNGSTGYTYFHWSTNPQLATMHTTGVHIVIANSAAQTFNASLTGLAASTKYYFQTVFHNSANGSLHFGSILSFTTSTGDATASPPAH